MGKLVVCCVVAASIVVGSAAPGAAGVGQNFGAHLTGAAELPARDTAAVGQTKLQLNAEGTELFCRLIASNIENVVQAHIHLGAPDQNGPVVAFLYGVVPAGGGRTSGVLSTTTVTASDLRGPLAGHSLQDLLDAIRAGNAYVNVHTNDGVGAINTGPGDFPGGEIRGTIAVGGPHQ